MRNRTELRRRERGTNERERVVNIVRLEEGEREEEYGTQWHDREKIGMTKRRNCSIGREGREGKRMSCEERGRNTH